MSRNNLLLRDCAACVGTVLGGTIFYLGLIMMASAVIGFLVESVWLDSTGFALHPHLGGSTLAAFAVTGVLAAFFGYRTCVTCIEEVPDHVRARSKVAVVIALLAGSVFLAFEPLHGNVWAAIAAVIVGIALVSYAKTLAMFRL